MVDYSKWKKIEISDDEDDTHPNIDTASLFRWRHKARLERAETQRATREELATKQGELVEKLARGLSAEDQEALRNELSELERKLADLNKTEKQQPWNVDTISQDTWSGTVINKKCLGTAASTSAQGERKETLEEKEGEAEVEEVDDQLMANYGEHVQKYEPEIKQFAFLSRFEDSRRFLLNHPNVVHKHTFDYLSLWCVDLHLDGKQALFEHVARQAVILELIMDLAKTAGGGIDPRSCLKVFFDRSARSKDKFDKLFEDELAHFKERILKAAQFRLDQALKQQEANPESLIGPGGLNAQEVLESLPEELQKCFETRSREQLKAVLDAMEPEVANYHMQRCIDSGLWYEDGKDAEEDEDEKMLAAIREQQLSSTAGDYRSMMFEDDEDGEEDDDEEIEQDSY